MDDSQRIKLNELIRNYGAEDTTNDIRRLKHSQRIKEQVGIIENLKKKHHHLIGKNFDMFRNICIKHACFLYENYMDLFNRLIKNELDLKILTRFIKVLEKIENGQIDQHEGSAEIGQLLKELYIDSALRGDKKSGKMKKHTYKKPIHKLSWKEFKSLHEDE